jgi:ubiquinone/menaquinone biosynthesis C-methylase UbiE
MNFQSEPLMQLGALAATLYSADQSGVLSAILSAPKSAAALAAELSLDLRALLLLLDVLETQGLVSKQGERYSLSGALLENMIGPMAMPGFWGSFWGMTADFLRTGQGHQWCTTNEGRGALYSSGVVYLADKFAIEAKRLAEILSPMLPAEPSLLDIGAGAGNWSLSTIKHHQAGSATGLDLGPVVERFKEHAARLGVEHQAHTLTGDYFEAPVPEASFDAILFANVLHLEPKERANQLLTRWVPALKPGGKIIVVDVVEDPENPEQQKARAAYALHLSLRLPGARVHPQQEIFDWMREAGAKSCSHHLLAGSGLSALIGHL